jgi:aldehyde:ferredoxin oxidoreductase
VDIEHTLHQQESSAVPGGYTGKLLRVNLTHSKITVEGLNPALLREYLGGTGLGIRLIYDEVKPAIDPLGPDAKLVIATGPVTATVLGTAGRFQVVFKSPQTGILCDSSSGGHWGAMLKYSGFDVLVIEGQSAEPVFLYVHDRQVELRSATHLWGVDAYQTRDQLRADLEKNKASVLCIGPAGENLVTYASMVNDAGRVAARGGAGAVMGSKKLKAIVVHGTLPVELADQQEFKRLALAIALMRYTGHITTSAASAVHPIPFRNGCSLLWRKAAPMAWCQIWKASLKNIIRLEIGSRMANPAGAH